MRRFVLSFSLLLAAPALAQAPPATAPSAATASVYRLAGAPALRPSKIWDDGWYTYIEWPEETELPAVFSRGPDGHEVLAEGTMINDRYVLDRVHTLLIFRIDGAIATARRGTAKR